MQPLLACPFCRQLFTAGEVRKCPECALVVVPFADLPLSPDAEALEPHEDESQLLPEDQPLSWAFMGRTRGGLIAAALLGIALFFAPWLHESTPEIRTWSGFAFARQLGWLWAAGVAWFVMLALVLSRRTIRQMRGARLAVALLAGMVLSTVLFRIFITPTPHPLVPLRFEWGWGLYASGLLAALTLGLSWRFGGSLVDMPSNQKRRGTETVH